MSLSTLAHLYESIDAYLLSICLSMTIYLPVYLARAYSSVFLLSIQSPSRGVEVSVRKERFCRMRGRAGLAQKLKELTPLPHTRGLTARPPDQAKNRPNTYDGPRVSEEDRRERIPRSNNKKASCSAPPTGFLHINEGSLFRLLVAGDNKAPTHIGESEEPSLELTVDVDGQDKKRQKERPVYADPSSGYPCSLYLLPVPRIHRKNSSMAGYLKRFWSKTIVGKLLISWRHTDTQKQTDLLVESEHTRVETRTDRT